MWTEIDRKAQPRRAAPHRDVVMPACHTISALIMQLVEDCRTIEPDVSMWPMWTIASRCIAGLQ